MVKGGRRYKLIGIETRNDTSRAQATEMHKVAYLSVVGGVERSCRVKDCLLSEVEQLGHVVEVFRRTLQTGGKGVPFPGSFPGPFRSRPSLAWSQNHANYIP